jgi:hypothetical protein
VLFMVTSSLVCLVVGAIVGAYLAMAWMMRRDGNAYLSSYERVQEELGDAYRDRLDENVLLLKAGIIDKSMAFDRAKEIDFQHDRVLDIINQHYKRVQAVIFSAPSLAAEEKKS